MKHLLAFPVALCIAALPHHASAAPPAGSPCITEPGLPECVWWRNQVNDQTGIACCGAPGQDGHILNEWDGISPPKELDWRIEYTIAAQHEHKWPQGCPDILTHDDPSCDNDPSGYQVFYGGHWNNVPWKAQTSIKGVEPDADHRYHAKGWWSTSSIGAWGAGPASTTIEYWYCFQAGAGL